MATPSTATPLFSGASSRIESNTTPASSSRSKRGARGQRAASPRAAHPSRRGRAAWATSSARRALSSAPSFRPSASCDAAASASAEKSRPPLRAAAPKQRSASAWSPAWRRFQPSCDQLSSSHGLATARSSMRPRARGRARGRAAEHRLRAGGGAHRLHAPGHRVLGADEEEDEDVARAAGDGYAGVDEATRGRAHPCAVDHGAVVLEHPAAAVLARVAQPDVHRQRREVGMHRQRVVPARGVVLDDERLVHAQPIGAEPKPVGRRRQVRSTRRPRGGAPAAMSATRASRVCPTSGYRASGGPPPAPPPARRRARRARGGQRRDRTRAISSTARCPARQRRPAPGSAPIRRRSRRRCRPPATAPHAQFFVLTPRSWTPSCPAPARACRQRALGAPPRCSSRRSPWRGRHRASAVRSSIRERVHGELAPYASARRARSHLRAVCARGTPRLRARRGDPPSRHGRFSGSWRLAEGAAARPRVQRLVRLTDGAQRRRRRPVYGGGAPPRRLPSVRVVASREYTVRAIVAVAVWIGCHEAGCGQLGTGSRGCRRRRPPPRASTRSSRTLRRTPAPSETRTLERVRFGVFAMRWTIQRVRSAAPLTTTRRRQRRPPALPKYSPARHELQPADARHRVEQHSCSWSRTATRRRAGSRRTTRRQIARWAATSGGASGVRRPRDAARRVQRRMFPLRRCADEQLRRGADAAADWADQRRRRLVGRQRVDAAGRGACGLGSSGKTRAAALAGNAHPHVPPRSRACSGTRASTTATRTS